MTLILPFKELKATDSGIAGGKGASLGEMTQAGIPVPPGFVVLSTTFDKFIEETHLAPEIDAILDGVNHSEIHTVENASEKIQALIHNADMPRDIGNDIQSHFKKLDCQFVAVRSSATSEDSADAAWAGQLDSYLNTPAEQLLENVKRCWASLFTPRAIFYRFEKDLHKQQISVAVVVQKMVESEVSGIAFSVHPVTQDYNQMIVEAGFGLGEAIVSGQITPDSYVIEKQPLRILDRNISAQNRSMVRGETGGSVWQDIPEEKGGKQALGDEQIIELAHVILSIEQHYGFPCDIEWAFENAKFYIVQSRPITTISKNFQAKFEWKKNWAGKWTLLECCHFGREYTELLANHYEVGPKHTLFTFEDGFSANFLVSAEVKAFTDNLVEKVNQDHSVATEWANTITVNADRVLEFVRGFESRKISKVDFETLWERLDDYLLVHFPIKKVVDYLPQEILEQVLPVLEKARVYAEPVYAESLEFVQKFGKDNAPDFDLTPELFLCMTVDEIDAAFRNHQVPPEALLKQRYAFSVLEVTEGKARIFSGEEARQLAGRTVHHIESKQTIRGMTAFPGKVQGRVCIVFNPAEVSSLAPDTVLVTGMTRPDYLHLFKAAVAVVTDAGGVLSHAAITARELKKPTVTGTEIATKVLKDGDLVEVDADNGIVRRLEG